MRQSDTLRNTFKKDIKLDRYGEYCKFIYDIRNEYKYIFKDDLEKIKKEKARLQLEIKCKQTPGMGYMMTIMALVLGFVLKDIIYGFLKEKSLEFAVFVSLIYALLIVITFGILIVKTDTKLRCYMFALQALTELEEELKLEKTKGQVSSSLISKSIEEYK